jgi:hypothetical protein
MPIHNCNLHTWWKGMDLVSNTKMLLASHLLNIITIIPLKGRWDYISVWNPISFINICHHAMFCFLWTIAFSSRLSAYNIIP